MLLSGQRRNLVGLQVSPTLQIALKPGSMAWVRLVNE